MADENFFESQALESTQAKPTQVASPIPEADPFGDIAEADPFGEVSLELDSEGLPEQPPVDVGGEFGQAQEFQEGEEIIEGAVPPAESIDEFKSNVFAKLEDLKQRATLSFAGNDREKVEFLKKTLGADNVRLKDGDIFFRRKDSTKFRKLDPGTEEFLRDFLPDILDFSREAFEEAVALPFEVAGGIAGGPTVLGAPAGVVAGRTVGITAAQKLADDLAVSFGIPRDPERNLLTERAINTALSIAIPAGLGKLTRSKKTAQALSDGKLIKQEDLLTKRSQEILDISDEMAKSGLIQKMPGSDTNILVWQVSPHSAEAKSIAQQFSGNPQVEKFLVDQGKAYDETITGVLRQAASGKGLSKAVPEERLPFLIDNIARTTRLSEGKEIGKFRKLAAKASSPSTKHQLSEETLGAVNQLNEFIGASPGTKPDVDLIMRQLGISSKSATTNLINTVTELSQKINRGLRMDEFQPEIQKLAKEIDSASSRNPQIKRLYQAANSNLRADRNRVIKQFLSPEDGASYDNAMGGFQKTLNQIDNLGNSLDSELSQEALVRDIFSSGRQGLRKFKAVKGLLKEQHPDVYNNVVNTYMDGLIAKHSRDNLTGLNSAGVRKELAKLGKNFGAELFEGTDVNLQIISW